MKTYVGSDFHWGHRNIMNFCPESRARYKNDLDYMNEKMVIEWNAIVQPDDLVYLLGDVAFLPAQKAVQYMQRCNGRKILIEGNHDRKLVKDPAFQKCFEEIHQYLEIQHNKTQVCMFHYPVFDHNGAGRGSIMLHGHRHGNPHNIPGRIMDVGMDATGSIVVELDAVIEKLSKVQHMYHHD
jgi:calcineurin-like phosphoesterase family protein